MPPVMRIPYTAPLPPPTIFPDSVSSISGAVDALTNFLTPRRPRSPHKSNIGNHDGSKTLILSGAGISVASGLADYRGTNGTYTLNKTYRPIYFGEFTSSHAARRRYWARSFLGWPTLAHSQPNAAHHAVGALGRLGYVRDVVTQNVDSFHPRAHPALPHTLELHGYLRRTVCVTCRAEYDRARFQNDLEKLNPAWATFLAEMLASGALTTEDPARRRALGLKTNPDGDVDVPGVDYATFRYPPCPRCLQDAGRLAKEGLEVRADADGAWTLPEESSTTTKAKPAGILKPAVIMFGESISNPVKLAVESAVDAAARVLVLGSSLATYSAWRLVKRAKEQGKPVAIANLGGVRGEEQFFTDEMRDGDGSDGLRCSLPLETLLPALVEQLEVAAAPAAHRDSVGSQGAFLPGEQGARPTHEFRPAPWR